MGDCEPGPGCHDHDGWLMLRGWMLSSVIAAGFGLVVGAIAAGLRTMLGRMMAGPGLLAILVVVTVALTLLSIEPAVELLEHVESH